MDGVVCPGTACEHWWGLGLVLESVVVASLGRPASLWALGSSWRWGSEALLAPWRPHLP